MRDVHVVDSLGTLAWISILSETISCMCGAMPALYVHSFGVCDTKRLHILLPMTNRLRRRVNNLLSARYACLKFSCPGLSVTSFYGVPRVSLRNSHSHRNSRSGELVRRVRLIIVDVVVNTRVGGRVELVGGSTAGDLRARARDLEVDALGVELGTADIVGGVKGKNLVAENVVARLDVAGDLNLPVQTTGEQFIRSPLSMPVSSPLQTNSRSRGNER